VEYVQTPGAPEAIGPYAQAVASGGWVFCSGQIPLDPHTMEVVGGGIETQTQQVFNNLQAVLKAAGMTLQHVVKTTVFLADLNDFQAMNAVYGRAFGDHKPARATVEVSKLPRGVRVEIECIASEG